MISRVVLAAVETRSFARAEVVLKSIGEIDISGRHVGRLAGQHGRRLIDRQRQRAEAHRRKELPVEVENPPGLAVVEMDGGRIRTRQPGHGPGTHQPAWRETKNALFLRMSSEIHAEDPCPEPPDSLQNRSRLRQLVLEMSGTADGVPDAGRDQKDQPEEHALITVGDRYSGPQRLMRTCLSSLDEVHAFGRLMTAEAHRKGFGEAPRRAFVADGMACNWGVWQRHFAGYVPIVDFLHAVSYVYHAAVAVGGGAAEDGQDFGWGLCLEWTRALWQGRVSDVLAELAEWQRGQPPVTEEEGEAVCGAGAGEEDPRRRVQAAVTYLTNNQSRMDYPRYRREGLPLTSSLMESLVKEINWRVKGSEKFWNDPDGATPMLALTAAALSDDSRLESALT